MFRVLGLVYFFLMFSGGCDGVRWLKCCLGGVLKSVIVRESGLPPATSFSLSCRNGCWSERVMMIPRPQERDDGQESAALAGL